MDQMSSRVYDLAFNAWTVSTASAHEYRHLTLGVTPIEGCKMSAFQVKILGLNIKSR
jgi:hypothetical protein